ALAAVAAACAGSQGTTDQPGTREPPSPPPVQNGAATPAPGDWTGGIVDVEREVTGVTTLARIRAARNEGFDRIVLEFEGAEIPSYHIEYIDRPVRQCGSGNVVEIAGDG